jgi:hypothetical protein
MFNLMGKKKSTTEIDKIAAAYPNLTAGYLADICSGIQMQAQQQRLTHVRDMMQERLMNQRLRPR